METNSDHIIFIAMFAIALLAYLLIDRLRAAKKQKEDIFSSPDTSSNNVTLSNSAEPNNDPADSSRKESMFFLFNDLSIQQIEDGIEGIKNYFEKNFSINLAAYKEGWELISDSIDCPEKREKMYDILDNTIIETQKMHFLTKTGRLECKVFKTEKKSVELSFPHIEGIRKECYIN